MDDAGCRKLVAAQERFEAVRAKSTLLIRTAEEVRSALQVLRIERRTKVASIARMRLAGTLESLAPGAPLSWLDQARWLDEVEAQAEQSQVDWEVQQTLFRLAGRER